MVFCELASHWFEVRDDDRPRTYMDEEHRLHFCCRPGTWLVMADPEIGHPLALPQQRHGQMRAHLDGRKVGRVHPRRARIGGGVFKRDRPPGQRILQIVHVPGYRVSAGERGQISVVIPEDRDLPGAQVHAGKAAARDA